MSDGTDHRSTSLPPRTEMAWSVPLVVYAPPVNDVKTMSGMSRSLTLPSQLVSSSGRTMGAIITSVENGVVMSPPHA